MIAVPLNGIVDSQIHVFSDPAEPWAHWVMGAESPGWDVCPSSLGPAPGSLRVGSTLRQATGGSGMCQADLAAIPGETGVILVASVRLWCMCDEDGLSLPPSFFLRGNGTRLT